MEEEIPKSEQSTTKAATPSSENEEQASQNSNHRYQKDDSKGRFEEQTDIDSAVDEKKNELGRNDFRRIGFYRALSSDLSSNQFPSLPQHVKDLLATRWQRTNKANAEELEHWNRLIEHYRSSQIEIMADLKRLRNEKSDLQDVLHEKLAKGKQIRAELCAKLGHLFAKAKSSAQTEINIGLEQSTKEINALADNHLVLARRKQLEESNNALLGATAMEERVRHLKEKRAIIDSRISQLRSTVELLSKATPAGGGTAFLLSLAAAGLIGSGWLFANSSLFTALGVGDYFSYIIGGFIASIIRIVQPQASPLMELSSLVAGLLALLAITTAVGIGAAYLKQRFLKNRLQLEILKFKSDKGTQFIPFWRNMARPPLSLTWLGIIPYVFLAGVVLILLAYSPGAVTKFDQLVNELSKQTAGITFAVILAVFMYFYLMTVVEQRLLSLSESTGRSGEGHKELKFALYAAGAITILLTALTLLSVIAPQWISQSLRNESIGVAVYLLVTFITAISLAYVIRIRGLHIDMQNLVRIRENISAEILDASGPPPLDLSSLEDDEFLKKVQLSRKFVEDLLSRRNEAHTAWQIARKAIDFPTDGQGKNSASSLWRVIRIIPMRIRERIGLSPKEEAPIPVDQDVMDLIAFDPSLAPNEYEKVLQDLNELHSVHSDFLKVKEQLDKLESYSGPRTLTLERKLTQHGDEIMDILSQIRRLDAESERRLVELEREIQRAESEYFDGYSLGRGFGLVLLRGTGATNGKH